uniref:Cytochrome c oxidase subunit 2 n=1 Tax=Alloxysta sp. ZJUH_2016001 TaxID=2491149 RepID=A0A3Q8U9V7_9HYME|nr:cytochrome c oxidase subunit 2 [Alloxysta sp. ZJUH_2016001]
MNIWYNLNLLDACSPNMEWMIKFHDFTLMVMFLITIVIFFILMKILMSLYICLNIESQLIEVVWTILPVIVLTLMAIPSLKILYLMDEMYTPLMSIKCIGHQWYWSYEMPDFNNLTFDSFMNKNLDKIDVFRLLDVDSRLVTPMNLQIRLLISSEDVIHSFAVPSMGLKVDGIPGRVNQLNLLINRPGLYFGQCSEICGANHSFMPIVIESTSLKNFLNWIKDMN